MVCLPVCTLPNAKQNRPKLWKHFAPLLDGSTIKARGRMTEMMNWIFLLKLVHTFIFFCAAACILYVLYCGLFGKKGRYLWWAAAFVFTIGVIFAANGLECPISTLIYKLAGRRGIPDIFLPDWIATKIMPVSTPIYTISLLLVFRNLHRGRA
jgi:hypothetical protein